ncbi:hypothetical protein, partial [Lacimonas salitolerans]
MLKEIRQLNPMHRNLFAFVCLIAACIIGSLTYPSYSFWFFPKSHQFLPSLTSGLIALLLLAPIIRGDFLHSHKLDTMSVINLGPVDVHLRRITVAARAMKAEKLLSVL